MRLEDRMIRYCGEIRERYNIVVRLKDRMVRYCGEIRGQNAEILW